MQLRKLKENLLKKKVIFTPRSVDKKTTTCFIKPIPAHYKMGILKFLQNLSRLSLWFSTGEIPDIKRKAPPTVRETQIRTAKKTCTKYQPTLISSTATDTIRKLVGVPQHNLPPTSAVPFFVLRSPHFSWPPPHNDARDSTKWGFVCFGGDPSHYSFQKRDHGGIDDVELWFTAASQVRRTLASPDPKLMAPF